jgi:MFS transporter, DHA1 family, multidrug resistance protein
MLAVLLASLAMIEPFAIDTYLPSFPAIENDFAASPLQIQQTVSVYLLGFALMILFHGTLSDSFGRRAPISCNLLVFVIAAIGCAIAGALEQLLLFRTIQAPSAGADIVIGRAIIRDRLDAGAVAPLLSHSAFALASDMANRGARLVLVVALAVHRRAAAATRFALAHKRAAASALRRLR